VSTWVLREVVLQGKVCSPRHYSPALRLQHPMIWGELRRLSVRRLPRLIPLRTRMDTSDRQPTHRRESQLPITRTAQPKPTLRKNVQRMRVHAEDLAGGEWQPWASQSARFCALAQAPALQWLQAPRLFGTALGLAPPVSILAQHFSCGHTARSACVCAHLWSGM